MLSLSLEIRVCMCDIDVIKKINIPGQGRLEEMGKGGGRR